MFSPLVAGELQVKTMRNIFHSIALTPLPIGRQFLSRYIWTSQFSQWTNTNSPAPPPIQHPSSISSLVIFLCGVQFFSWFDSFLCALWRFECCQFRFGDCDKTAKYDRQQHETNEWIRNEENWRAGEVGDEGSSHYSYATADMLCVASFVSAGNAKDGWGWRGRQRQWGPAEILLQLLSLACAVRSTCSCKMS